MILIGPFSQIITMGGLPLCGPLKDDALVVIPNGGVLVNKDKIVALGSFNTLRKKHKARLVEITGPACLLPGLIDAHTHICHAGSRANDYALRVAGKTYLEILKQGGGILDSVRKTRAASRKQLCQTLSERATHALRSGVTTCEVKSGYGLTVDDEIKMLEVIKSVHKDHPVDLVPSCLAAHVKPPEFDTHKDYLNFVATSLLPVVVKKKLSRRVDVFVEEGAFSSALSRPYLQRAAAMGFDLIIHADQFSTGGSRLACEVKALSADHLEASTDADIRALAKAGVIATVLPGASLGLGMPFAPARKLLDHGCSVVIASDWNPGSAPMGDLWTQAAVFGAAQKLSTAETFAGMTFRAARALRLHDRGVLWPDMLADMQAFPCKDYREILYHQGQLKPNRVWKKGVLIVGEKEKL
ncbi:MAG: imidazolonepropionase [Deltaproteobacteria bacterium]|nr:imidazolonepropionase [Deltaproteobacteria bacterium]